MRVKIGDEWFDSKDEPICVELTEQDKRNIQNMASEAELYAVFPDIQGWKKEECFEWMEKGRGVIKKPKPPKAPKR